MQTSSFSSSTARAAEALHWATADIHTQVRGGVGFITLNRPRALNALSLGMIRSLYATLRAWQADADIVAVAIRGSNKEGAFGAFCAGGDIRFFHDEAASGNPQMDDFFTEEYALDYLIHTLGKPYIAFMDGIVMGGGMGISQGATLRIVTERTRMAMPETLIGLFPDVGGGYFLSRCPGRVGEWLALAGTHILGADSVSIGLADCYLPSSQQAAVWQALGEQAFASAEAVQQWVRAQCAPVPAVSAEFAHACAQADMFFGADSVQAIVDALEAATDNAWAQQTAAELRKRSPLLLCVVLEQIRRARHMPLDEELCMERDLMRHCLFTAHLGRTAVTSEMVEGVRALVVDKDNAPRWRPARIEDMMADAVQPFFVSPWPVAMHPLRLALLAQRL